MSSRRVSFGDKLRQTEIPLPPGRGAGAFLPDDTAAGPPLPIAGNPESATQDVNTEKWDTNHKRVTFYCPMDLLSALDDAVRRTGRSKTQILTDGLRLAFEQPARGKR